MNIGIIGAGGIGQAFAAHVAKAGYEVIVSNSRGPELLAGVVSQLGAHVVKVANTLPSTLVSADPKQGGGRRVLFMSRDDAAAKADVSGILDKVGFATIDLGGLASGGRLQQFPGGSLPNLNLIKLD
jgi:predicted dinucleotide-binding enzyme